jgi:hypothetical protein
VEAVGSWGFIQQGGVASLCEIRTLTLWPSPNGWATGHMPVQFFFALPCLNLIWGGAHKDIKTIILIL